MHGVWRGAAWATAALALLGLWLLPDAISRRRQAGTGYVPMDPACDLAQGPCSVALDRGRRVTLTVEPLGAPAATPLTFRVEVEGEAEPRAIELQGVDMNMGLFRLPLHPTGSAGTWQARGVLPVCTQARMAWHADVLLDGAVAGFTLWSRSG